MQKYFFDIQDGEKTFRDKDGLDCASIEDVRYQAVRALPDMAFDELPDGQRRLFRVLVRNQSDRVIFRATLTFLAEYLDESPTAR